MPLESQKHALTALAQLIMIFGTPKVRSSIRYPARIQAEYESNLNVFVFLFVPIQVLMFAKPRDFSPELDLVKNSRPQAIKLEGLCGIGVEHCTRIC